jgi:hypothetical protein
MQKILSRTEEFTITIEERRVFVNKVQWGFTMTNDEGKNFIVRHCRLLEKFNRELGFYMPAPLAALPHLFEVNLGHSIVQYQYNPLERNRLIKTGAHIFASISRMVFTTNAAHIVRLRKPSCKK